MRRDIVKPSQRRPTSIPKVDSHRRNFCLDRCYRVIVQLLRSCLSDLPQKIVAPPHQITDPEELPLNIGNETLLTGEVSPTI